MKHITSFIGILFIQLFLFAGITNVQAQVSTYPTPPNAVISTVFQLSSDGVTIPVYKYMDYHYAHFSLKGTANFKVTTTETISGAKISPLSLKIAGTKSGSSLSFPLSQIATTNETPNYLVVQINSLEKLVILVDKPEVDVPAPWGSGIFNVTSATYNADKTGVNYTQPAIQKAIDDASSAGGGIVYVPAGIYKIKENLSVKSNVTLYLAPGSVLKAIDVRSEYALNSTIDPALIVETGASNVCIKGRGEIDASGYILMSPPAGFTSQSVEHPRRRVIQIDGNKNVTFDGIVVKDASGWTMDLRSSNNVVCQNVKVLNHKDYTYKIEDDGIDMTSSSNSKVNQCFVMTIDDAMCAKARYSDMDNVEFSNNVIYTSAAGVKGGMQSVGNMTNIVFRNCDVIYCYRGIGVDTKEGTLPIANVVFRDIRVEESHDHCVDIMAANAVINNINILDCNCLTDNRLRTYGAFAVNNTTFKGLVLKGIPINSDADAALNATLDISSGDTYSFSNISDVAVTSISVVPTTSPTFNVGTVFQLVARVLPATATNRTVTWSSSNETVATVDAAGKVIGVKAGTSIITATTVDGGLKAGVVVNIVSVATILPTGISITPTKLVLLGATAQLSATITPTNTTNQTITWTTSNPAIATVSETGTVSGIALGSATITAKTDNGAYSSNSVITVVNILLPSSISVSPSSANVFVGSNLQLSATVLPANTTSPTVTWLSSDPTVATVDNTGKVNGLKAGVATITGKTDNNLIATSQITVVNLFYKAIFEAENATIVAGTINPGASGQFVDLNAGASITWSNINAPIAAIYPLTFNVGVPSASTRSMGVFVNGSAVKAGVVTSSLVGYADVVIFAPLIQGVNTIKLSDSEGTQELNVDYLSIPILVNAPSALKSTYSDSSNGSFGLFPNPLSNGMLTVEVVGTEAQQLSIYTTGGTLVYKKQLAGSAKIDVTNVLKSGIYIVKLAGENAMATKMLIVK